MQKKPELWYSAGLVDDANIYEWEVTIIGSASLSSSR
jgi:hypothetical protein